MGTPFKMKGWSPFTQKTGKGPIMPKDHPVIPPTEVQSEEEEGTVKAGGNRTPGFQPKKELKSIKKIWGDKWRRMLENPNPFTKQ